MNTYQNIYTNCNAYTMEEYHFINEASAGLTSFQMQTFMLVYNSRRKNPQDILLGVILGFIGFAGVQRFMTNQVVWGIIYFLTGGLFLLGTIADLFTYKSIANDYNRGLAYECCEIARAAN